MALRAIVALTYFLLLSGCGITMTDDNFKSQKPALVLEEYFAGYISAEGLFEDRFGNVRNLFSVDINGRWDGQRLTLDEDFRYNDGSTEFRRWLIEKTGANTYRGTTENSIGEAIGIASGNSFHWQYHFNLDVGGSRWKVKFDDWMFLQQNGVLLNKATVYRWGFKIGTVFLAFTKHTATSEQQAPRVTE